MYNKKLTFLRKGQGRLYTNSKESVDRIKNIIREMDEFEYKYMPDNLIAVFEGKIEHIYTGKFDDLDLDELLKRCWNEGIYIFFTYNPNEYTP